MTAEGTQMDRMSDAGHDTASDWPGQAADFVERTVGTVRDKATVPAIKIARGLVYGTVAAFCAVAIAVLVAIVLVRILNAYLPWNVWFAHLVVGIVFVVLGAICWRLRTRRES
jgi:hypothetical protein